MELENLIWLMILSKFQEWRIGSSGPFAPKDWDDNFIISLWEFVIQNYLKLTLSWECNVFKISLVSDKMLFLNSGKGWF